MEFGNEHAEAQLGVVYHVQVSNNNVNQNVKLKAVEGCTYYTLVTQSNIGDMIAEEERLRFMPGTYDQNGNKEMIIWDFKVVAGVKTATLTWRQHQCFPEFDLLIIPVDDCTDMEKKDCLEEWNFQSFQGSSNDQSMNSYVVDKLQNCSQYRAILRSRGMSVGYIYVYCCAIVECSCR